MANVFKNFFIASDHAGFELKQKVLAALKEVPWADLGPFSEDSVDYPDFAAKLIEKIVSPNDVGILICGSGQGMAIRANRASHIRAALCWSEEIAQLSRLHNDANVICIGGRVTDHDLAFRMIQIFLTTAFEGGRHARRVEKLRC